MNFEMFLLAKILLWLIALAFLVPSLILFIECLAACFISVSQAKELEKCFAKTAILIPAHNEAETIGTTLEILLPQLTSNDRLIVIADNCSDKTATIARQYGVTVIERQNLEQRGKGYALDYGIHFLENNPPDVVILIDADCRVEGGTLAKITQLAFTSGKPVQATYLIEQPPNPSTKDIISALAFLIKNQVRSTGLAQMGLPCLLGGTGMAFPWSVINNAPLASDNLVEDMQLGIDLAIAGTAPIFCPEAKVTGILPQQQQVAKTQRTRWEHGHLQTLLTQVPRLLKFAIVQRRFELLTLALELGVPPLSLLVLLGGVGLIITFVAGLSFSIWLPAIIVAVAGCFIFLAILAGWIKYGRKTIPGKALLSIPFYLLWKIPLYFAFLFKREKQWIRTERDALIPPKTD